MIKRGAWQTCRSLQRALVSVSNKAGLVDFARGLSAAGLEILSTGGTAKALAEAGVPVREVSDFTGAPEVLDGRVKTLHPRVHGGILGRPTEKHRKEMQQAGFVPIDLVVVNLYPFRETVARGAPFEEVIENIDIGGPAMISSAAKNHERVAVVVDPARLRARARRDPGQRRGLGGDALRARAQGLRAHGGVRRRHRLAPRPRSRRPRRRSPTSPRRCTCRRRSRARCATARTRTRRRRSTRSTERPGAGGPSLAKAEVLQGKELSYNNLLDLDAAMRLCAEFALPAAAIIKHSNPCGAAVAEAGVAEAYRRARETDPVSAFGGIVAVNRQVDAALAREMSETFLECVIAPSYAPEALQILADEEEPAPARLRLLGRRRGRARVPQRRGRLARADARHGRPSAAADGQGRLEARAHARGARRPRLRLARLQARQVERHRVRGRRAHAGRRRGPDVARRLGAHRRVEGARARSRARVVASDAFFPFRDGVDEAAKAGAVAVIQPGGSVRDEESIAAADEHGMAMVFTGERHFRH